MYTDLATVHNSTDMNNLITLVSNTVTRAWIGLEVTDVRMWHWSLPDQKLDFFNWKAGEPQNQSEDACAAMDQHGEWFESQCTAKKSFVCRGEWNGNNAVKVISDFTCWTSLCSLCLKYKTSGLAGNSSGLIFVAENSSWRDAQNYCRDLSSDLISIHSAEENEAVHNVSLSQNVWIGLFKDPWKWSDGSNSSFRYWKTNQPNYRKDQDCVAAIFKDKGKWNDKKCTVNRKFICYGGELITCFPCQTMWSCRICSISIL